MAVAATALTAGNSETDATSYATASISPTGNRLVLAVVRTWRAAGEPGDTATATGGGMTTWTKVATRAAAGARMTLFRALQASPTSGAVTFGFGGVESQDAAAWAILEFSDVVTTGTNGADAVVQSATGAGTSTTPLATLAAFGDAGNATFGSIGSYNATDHTAPGTGFTEIQETGNGDTRVATEFRNDNDTTVNATLDNSVEWDVIAVEIAAAVVGGDPEGSLVGGKLIRGGLLKHGVLVRAA